MEEHLDGPRIHRRGRRSTSELEPISRALRFARRPSSGGSTTVRLISLRIDQEILAHCEELLPEINSARGKRRGLTISNILRQALKLGLERNDELRAALIASPPMLT